MKSTLLVLFTSIFLLSACANNKGSEGRKKESCPESPFENKNLVVFGNSITAAKNSWAYQLHYQLGFANLYNGAVGSAIWSKRERTTEGKTIQTQNYTDPDFTGISNRYTSDPDASELQKRINNCAIVHIQKYLSNRATSEPDIIILSYGTNDSNDPSHIGDVKAVLKEKELSKVDVFTMAGAVRWCIETLRKEFPQAKLYIAFPMQAASESRNKGNLEKISILKGVCDGMAVPYFDCYAECGITQENEADYLRDGLHPNEKGEALHTAYIIRKLKEANNIKN